METQIKVTAEKSTVLFPTIIVEQIMEPRSGSTKGKNLLVRWVTEPRVQGGSGLLGLFLGPLAQSNNEKRVALQFMANEVIADLKLDLNVNLNDAMKAAGHPAVRLSVNEITKKDFYDLKDSDQIGYSSKINPATGEVLCINGQSIYRKIFIDSIDGSDTYLSHDGSADSSDEPHA
tara:strand:- start:57 stop:584 length:528 start_codon:yes stop_codon:yes gene_type:complete